MPCSQRKARILLKQKKAKIIHYMPFTIQLLYATGEAKQEIHLGIDMGTKHIGIAITSSNNVIAKGEIILRQDVHQLLLKRKQLRRSRRIRKTRYRRAKFLNRKSKNLLTPSLQSRFNNILFWINKFSSLLPNPIIHIENAKFNIHKIIDPTTDYKHGKCFGYDNVYDYVLARDNHKCQICGNSKKLHIHHIMYKNKNGSERADNLITLCNKCHTKENHKKGKILFNLMQKHECKQFKDPTFMNIIKFKINKLFSTAIFINGSTTSSIRNKLNLPKTHYNDAIIISGIARIKENSNDFFIIKQFRKKKRSLHEAIPRKGRKNSNTTQKRNNKNIKQIKNCCLNDKVICKGKIGWVSGFSRDYAYIKDINDNYIYLPNKTLKIPLRFLKKKCSCNNWRYLIINESK